MSLRLLLAVMVFQTFLVSGDLHSFEVGVVVGDFIEPVGIYLMFFLIFEGVMRF